MDNRTLLTNQALCWSTNLTRVFSNHKPFHTIGRSYHSIMEYLKNLSETVKRQKKKKTRICSRVRKIRLRHTFCKRKTVWSASCACTFTSVRHDSWPITSSGQLNWPITGKRKDMPPVSSAENTRNENSNQFTTTNTEEITCISSSFKISMTEKTLVVERC